MTNEQALALCRKAERGLLAAYEWFPYMDEVDNESAHAKHRRAENEIREALALIRHRKDEAEQALLNIAEHAGR